MRDKTRVLYYTAAATPFQVKRYSFTTTLLAMLLPVVVLALVGFNVVDIRALNAELGVPVMVVARHAPRLELIKEALLGRVPGGRRKWALVERAGERKPVGGVYAQRAGLSLAAAGDVIRRFSVYGRLPEPLWVAHLIAAVSERARVEGARSIAI